MESLTHAYLRLIDKLEVNDKVANCKAALLHQAQSRNIKPEEYMAQHREDIVKIYKQADLSVICDLMDIGYSWREVMENYANNPMIINEYDDAALIKQYTDEVIELVNAERRKRSKTDFVEASDAFERIKKNLSKKYMDDDNSFSEYHDGEIVISMLVNEGYPEKTVADVLMKNTEHDEIYIKSLMEKCMVVKRAYSDIQAAPPLAKARNEFDVYRSLAKEHMAKLGIKTLSYSDDMAIFEQLKAIKLPDKFIRTAMLKASPVANEPGRKNEAYVEAVLSGDSNHSEFSDGLARQPVVDVEQEYKALIEIYNSKLKKKGITDGVKEGINRVYFDTLAVKELFNKHYSEADIVRVLKEFSPEDAARSFPGYTLWVMTKARKLIEKEEYILSKPPIILPEGSYSEVIAQGFAPKDIIISLLQKRLELNPSMRHVLHKNFVDKDLAESALSRYPDFDLDAMRGVFANFPRAIILSGSKMGEEKNYVENVVETAKKRIDKQKEANKESEQLKEAFRQKQDVLHQGVTGETASMKMPIYHVGRAALSMMQNNTDEMVLRKMIISNVDAPEDQMEAITNSIIKKNREVLNRMKIVEEHIPSGQDKSVSARIFYLNRLALQHELRKSINASMDPEIVKDMLAAKVYKKSEIKEVVQELSPIAAQPGRGQDYYLDYVYPTAVSLLRTEKEKLKTYHPSPRQQKEENADREYEYHKQQILEAIALPFETAMDVLIAETMLLQGYPEYEIAGALDECSPCRENQENYGLSVTKNAASKSIVEERETVIETTTENTYEDNSLVNSRVLSRNVTENIRTTVVEGGS